MKKGIVLLWFCLFTTQLIVAQNTFREGAEGKQKMRNGQFEEAQNLLYQAIQNSTDPDSILYYQSHYMDALARAGETEKQDSVAREILQILDNLDVSSNSRSFFYTRLSWIISREGKMDDAMNLADSALYYSRDKYSRSLALSLKGTLLALAESQIEGLKSLLEAEKLMDEIGYRGKDYGITLMNISNCYAVMDKTLRSRDYLNEAYPLLLDYYGEDHPNYNILKLFYSGELTERQEYQKANELLLECLAHFKEEQDHPSIMHTYHNLTDNSIESGDYKKALNYLEINLGFSKENNMDTSYNHAAILNTLVACLRDLEMNDKAWKRLQELETLCENYPTISQWYYRGMMSNKALLLSDRKEYQKADEIYAGLEIYIKENYGENTETLADHYYFRADNFLAMGKYEKALDYLNKCKVYYNNNYPALNQNNINLTLQIGRVLEEMGETELALDYYIKTKNAFDEGFGTISVEKDVVNDFTTVLGRDETYMDLFRILAVKSEKGTLSDEMFNNSFVWLEEAKAYYNLMISELYQVANSKYLIEQFHLIGSYGQEIYYRKYLQKKDEQYLWEALSLAEMTKNYARRIILNDRQAKKFAKIPDSLLQRDKDFNRQVQYYESMLVREYEDEVAYRLNTLRDEWHQFIQMLEEQYPDYYHLKYNPYSATGLDILDYSIAEKMDVLYYFIGSDRIYNYSVNEYGIGVQLLDSIEWLETAVAEYRKAMIDDNVQKFYSVGTKIYDVLIKTWEPSFTNENICIVPDNILCYLNYESLPKPTSKEVNSFKDIHYLIEDYNIHYRYEFTSTLTLNKKTAGKISSERGMAFVPVFEKKSFRESEVLTLPWSSSLADFLKERYNMLVFDRLEATKENFLANGPKADLLHLSTHAYTNDASPMQSYLLFAGEKGHPDSLTALEIIGTDLNAQMALLSACQTGLSDYELGFGLQSLAWSFEYAGCNNFLVSLWSIDDEVSTSILKDFYDILGDDNDQTVTRALRQSKIQTIQKAGIHKANPYYWAGMIFIGDDMDIEIVTAGINYQWLWLLIPILVIIFYFYYRKKTNARKHSSYISTRSKF